MSNATLDNQGVDGVTAAGTLTQYAPIVGSGSKGIEALAAMSDGEVMMGVSSANPVIVPGTWVEGVNCSLLNIGVSVSTSVVTITSADGTALSATNPGFIAMPSNANAGQMVVHKITANVTITAADMDGMLWGGTTGVGTGTVPCYIGYCADTSDANGRFFVSMVPHKKLSASAVGGIGEPGTTFTGRVSDIFLDSTGTRANYVDVKCCTFLGMRASRNSSDEWSFVALGGAEGVGSYYPSTFVFATGQRGAATGTYMAANGGTAPVWTTAAVNYRINKDGMVTCSFYMNGDGGADGAGAVDTWMALPIPLSAMGAGVNNIYCGHGIVNSQTGPGWTGVMFLSQSAENYTVIKAEENGTGNRVQNGDFTTGDRRWMGEIRYLAEHYA